MREAVLRTPTTNEERGQLPPGSPGDDSAVALLPGSRIANVSITIGDVRWSVHVGRTQATDSEVMEVLGIAIDRLQSGNPVQTRNRT